MLLSAVAGRTAEERRRVIERADLVRDLGIASVTTAAKERWFTDAFRARHPEIVQSRMAQLLANDPVSYAYVNAPSTGGTSIQSSRCSTSSTPCTLSH